MPNTITPNVQCSPITCVVAGATLNEESNAEALDTYTACGCEGASGASGLKNLLGGAAPFLIPLAAGFARRGNLSPFEEAVIHENRGDFKMAAKLLLRQAGIYREQNDLQGELTALNRADEDAKKINEWIERDGLRMVILERMANAYEGLAEYGLATEKMLEGLKLFVNAELTNRWFPVEKLMEGLELAVKERKYRQLLKMVDTGVETGRMTAAEGKAIREKANAVLRSAAGGGKGAEGPPSIDKDGQWALDPASAQMNARELW